MPDLDKILEGNEILIRVDNKYFINSTEVDYGDWSDQWKKSYSCKILVSKDQKPFLEQLQLAPYDILTYVHVAGHEPRYYVNASSISYDSYEEFYHNTHCITVSAYCGSSLITAKLGCTPLLAEFLSGTKHSPIDLDKLNNIIHSLKDDWVPSDHTINWGTTSGSEYVPSSDPFANYKNLQESKNAMKIALQDVGPSNRTLVAVYGSKDSSSDFKERAARLVGSLNMPDTIKAVVITINGNQVFSGLDFTEAKAPGKPDEDVLNSVFKRFVQVLEVRHGESS